VLRAPLAGSDWIGGDPVDAFVPAVAADAEHDGERHARALRLAVGGTAVDMQGASAPTWVGSPRGQHLDRERDRASVVGALGERRTAGVVLRRHVRDPVISGERSVPGGPKPFP